MKRSLKLLSLIVACLCIISLIPHVSAASVKGDINADGKITTEDARIALRISSAILKPSSAQITAGDMNGDGVITLSDVKSVLLVALDVDTFEENMLKAGFPISYVEYISALHEKYPEWEFEPFITGLDWQASIDGERSNPGHKQQLIENNVKASFMCSCSKCNGIIQEGSNWVSASEEAVKYYMDPRNFLTEEYIFQFESTAHSDTNTVAGVEAILDGTWMHDAYIKYLDGNGAEKTYKKDGASVKYSTAIMQAAEDSGMSAYYLASKIVQEVGSNSASNAGGSSGKNAPYNGIYNYYNIGAYTGVADGLRWANAYMKTTRSTVMYKTASTGAEQVVTIPSNAEVYYIAASGNFYKVSANVSGKTYKGFVAKSNISASTGYGRPWSDPYKSIYYGAKYIFESFSKYQFTGYLQKFNVNPASSSLYGHEYMANVRAAASESKHTYSAYADAGILKTKKVFSIPVFKNMPNADLTSEEVFHLSKPTLKSSASTADSITLSWSKLEKALKYQLYKYNASTDKYVKIAETDGLTYTDSSLKAEEIARYRVRGYFKNDDGKAVYSSYSDDFYGTLPPAVPGGLAIASKTEAAIKLKWNDVDNADIYQIYCDSGSGYKKVGTVSTNSFTNKSLSSGTTYKYKVRAATKTGSGYFYSAFCSAISAKTSGDAPAQSGTVKITDGYLNLRETASTGGKVLAQLPNGQTVSVLGTSGEWYKIKATIIGKEYTGYAHSDYVVIKEECPYAVPTANVLQGNSGNSVKWVQWYLWKSGYLKESDIDGDFGPTTLAAVKKFQSDNNLEADGIVGSGTRSALMVSYK